LNSVLEKNKRLSKIKQSEIKEIKMNERKKYQIKLEKIIEMFKSEFKNSVSKNIFVYKCANTMKSKMNPLNLTYNELDQENSKKSDYDSEMVASIDKKIRSRKRISASKQKLVKLNL